MKTLWRLMVSVLCVGLLAQAGHAQPTLEYELPKEMARAGTPYAITLRISWEGAPDAYVIEPARFMDGEALEWARLLSSETRTEMDQGVAVIRQILTIVPEMEGLFTTPTIEVSYSASGELRAPQGSVPVDPNAPMTLTPLRVPPFPVEVKPRKTQAGILIGLGVLLFFCTLGGWTAYRVRRRAARAAADTASGGRAPDSPLAAAEVHLRARDAYAFYRCLEAALRAQTLSGGEGELLALMTERVKDAGFRGARFTHESMELDLRAVRRALTNRG